MVLLLALLTFYLDHYHSHTTSSSTSISAFACRLLEPTASSFIYPFSFSLCLIPIVFSSSSSFPLTTSSLFSSSILHPRWHSPFVSSLLFQVPSRFVPSQGIASIACISSFFLILRLSSINFPFGYRFLLASVIGFCSLAMAVQAQHPSSDPFFNDLLIRSDNLGLSIATGGQFASNNPFTPNVARTANPVMATKGAQQNATLGERSVMIGTENLFKCNPHKRPRESEEAMNRVQSNAFYVNALTTAEASSIPSTSGRENHPTLSAMPVLSEELQIQLSKQKQEVEQLMAVQAEQLKQALEERRKKHLREMLATIELATWKRLKITGDELDKAKRKNMELEEKVRQLSLESQLWQNLAKNNELMAFNLRHSLDVVIAQTKEQMSKEGCGESQVEDAESCCVLGGEAAAHDAAHSFRDSKEMMMMMMMREQRKCKVCKMDEVCILLLPCRHLCLCKKCEGCLDVCPVCRTLKSASVQVYMD